MSGIPGPFKQDALEIEVVKATEPDPVQVVWKGVSDGREPGKALSPYLRQLAESLSSQKVVVDFRKFEYMNSATVGPIIQFIKRLNSLGAQTELRYDHQIHWQRVNFSCLKTIFQLLDRVRVEGS